MQRAIIIAGSEERFVKSAQDVQQYLTKQARIGSACLIHSARMIPEAFAYRLQRELFRQRGLPTLLVYIGHGNKGAWVYDDNDGGYGIRRKTLAQILTSIHSPLFLIDQSCHAGALIPQLEGQKWTHPIGLIAACPADQETEGCMDQILRSWRNRRVYDPRDYPIHRLRLGFSEIEVSLADGTTESQTSTYQEEETEEIIYKDRPRWGKVMDHYFFARA